MTRKLVTLAVVLVITSAGMFLAACASTQPEALTGSRPVVNDKGVVVGFAR